MFEKSENRKSNTGICLMCGNEYEKTNNKQKYCGNRKDSKSCSYKAHIIKNRKLYIPKVKKKVNKVVKIVKIKKEITPVIKEVKEKIIKEEKIVLCSCGNKINMYVNKDGKKTYKYSKYCNECFKAGVYFKKKSSRIKIAGIKKREYNFYRKKDKNSKYDFDLSKLKFSFRVNKIKRCDYPLCRCILPEIPENEKVNNKYIGKNFSMSFKNGIKKYYCNEWCKEMDNLPNIRECKKCGNAVSRRFISGRLQYTGTLCDNCLSEKYKKNNIFKPLNV